MSRNRVVLKNGCNLILGEFPTQLIEVSLTNYSSPKLSAKNWVNVIVKCRNDCTNQKLKTAETNGVLNIYQIKQK